MIGRAPGPVETDVLVIGGGAAGAIAALAAREEGARVTVVRRSFGATALSSGAADLAPDPVAGPGSPRGDRRSIRASVEALARRRPDHPYAVLAAELPALDEALAFAARATGGLLAFAPLDGENRLLLSPLGTLKATAGGLAATLAGDLAGAEGALGVVGFDLWPAVDPVLLARAGNEALAAAGVPARLVPLVVDFLRGEDDPLARPHELARRLAAPGALEGLAASIRRAAGEERFDRLLLPPVLAEGEPGPVLERLATLLGIPCAELPAGPPSLPGLRLQRLLDERLRGAGVELVHGELALEAGELRLRDPAPRLADPSRFDEGTPTVTPPPAPGFPVRAGAHVLATGKFLGGGVRRDGALAEPACGAPVWLGEGIAADRWPGDLTGHELAGEQPFFRVGVRIDASLRPLGASGAPVRADLFACGGVLAGNDAARDGAGLGLAVFTGWLAGRAAARSARPRKW